MPEELRIRLLGTPEITLGDMPLRFARRRAAVLLAYLVATRRVHSRETLAGLLYDARGDAEARKNLRNELGELTARLGDFLLVTRETIAFDFARPHWVDSVALEAALAAPGDSLSRLQSGVDLYRDEFLAGTNPRDAGAFEEWVQHQREYWRGLLLDGLQRLAEGHARRGATAPAIAAARRLLALDPWREEVHRLLMRLLARAGQRSAALAQYQACRRALAADLGLEPTAETTALYERLRGVGPPPSNLPAPPEPLVGRAAELALVRKQLAEPGCRLVTLVGLGGAGKTSPALAVAHTCHAAATADPDHPCRDGIFLVPLVGLRGGSLVGAIGQALGLSLEGATDPAGRLHAHLRDRALLLVLDNLEDLLAELPVLADILRRTREVKVLATSRVRLGLDAEWAVPLRGLAVPAAPGDVERSEAGQLFLRRARQVVSSFALAGDDRDQVSRICALVGGLPLALVLAASWLRGMSCAEVAAELARGNELLAAPAGGTGDAHASMRAILEPTLSQLPARQLATLARLAVFPGDFGLAATVAVAGVAPPDLLALVDAALLLHEAGRYRLHPLVRQHVAERHAALTDEAAERHAAYYAAFVLGHTAGLYETREALDTILTELANVRAALTWAATAGRIALVEQLREGVAGAYQMARPWTEGVAVFAEAAERLRAAPDGPRPDPARLTAVGLLLAEQARLLSGLGDNDRVRLALEEARDLALATGDLPLDARCAHHWGAWRGEQGDFSEARPQLERSLILSRALGLRRLAAANLRLLGALDLASGDPVVARRRGEEALALHRELNDRRGQNDALRFLSRAILVAGESEEARLCAEQALDLCRLLGDRANEVLALIVLGQICCLGGRRYREADAFLLQALQIGRDLGNRNHVMMSLYILGRNARCQGDLERGQAYSAEAMRLCRSSGYRVFEKDILRDLAMLALYRGDDHRALQLAREAVALDTAAFEAAEDAYALIAEGHALARLARWAEAASAYEAALRCDDGRWAGQLPEAVAGLARVALARGDHAQARACATTILGTLRERGRGRIEEPIWAYQTCYEVLRTARDPAATDVLTEGYSLLQALANQFTDEEHRRRFLTNVPAHAALLREWHHHHPQGDSSTDWRSQALQVAGDPAGLEWRAIDQAERAGA